MVDQGRGDKPEPFRAHVTRKGQIEDRPKVDPEARQCLATYVTIDNKRAYALFDSGSTADIVAPDFARIMQLSTFELTKLVPIRLGCVGSSSSIRSGANATIQIGGRTAKNVYLDIANVDRYDLILGNTFMYDMNIILDIQARTIYMGGFNGIKLKALTPGEEHQIVAERLAKKFAKARAKGKHLEKTKASD